MDKQLFYEMVDRYLAGTATAGEKQLVELWYEQLTEGSTELSKQEQERLDSVVLQAVLAQTHSSLQANEEPAMQSPAAAEPSRVVPIYRNSWFRYAAACALIVTLATGGWLLLKSYKVTADIASLPKEQRFKNDIAPALEGVTLTLGNNREIHLDSLVNGSQSLDNAIHIQKNDGELRYNENKTSVSIHTITTGKGNNYHLVLADGTGVWLDAESSLSFPTAFPGPDRSVTVHGQAYFEVAKDQSKPFRVKFQDQVVEVLGTHFNINAHEQFSRTTLLEGSVRIGNSVHPSRLLVPGEQVTLTSTGHWKTVADTDLDEVMAWKNGLFRFNGASIREVMMQLERWYHVNVVYADNIEEVSLVAKINRTENISTILNLLEMTDQLRFSINGNTITVMSAKADD